MKLIKVAGAALNQTPLAWDHNKNNIIAAIKKAKKEQVSILCLPELCITGYGCEDAFYAPGVHETALQILTEILPHTNDIIVSVGLPLTYQNRLFNTACIIVNKKIVGFVAKRFLAGNGIYYEPRWFTAWSQEMHIEIDIPQLGGSFPMGDIYFDIGGIKVGFEICEDAWVANRPGRSLFHRGIDIILNPSASHFAFDKLETRKRFVLEGSRAFGVGYVYANHLGNDAGRAIYDGGTIIASSGNLLAVGDRLTYDDYIVTSAIIDVEEGRMNQAQSSRLLHVPQEEENCVKIPFGYPDILPSKNNQSEADWEGSQYLLEEEFARAVTLGLFDYMRKSFSRGFVVSLSGGADSSSIVSLIYLMVHLGCKNIGFEEFKKKLSYFKELGDCKTEKEIVNKLLTTAYQPTENSGNITLNAAQKLAEEINAIFYKFDVNPIFKEYCQIIEKSLERELSWDKDDLALQNIQARVRAPSVWMMANIKGALLLSTSNRSEAAVGYATMDGDTSGGLSPIAGIDKAFIRKWLVWLEKTGVEGTMKIPSLKFVNEQQPTAELRPKDSKQSDESDLMPYDLLDDIEGAAIRDKKMPSECYLLMKVKYPQYSSEQLKTWVTKFFRLWSRNQWKRERYAPSFHLDDKNLDPKTWCRFPILSGGFEKELKELDNLN